MNADALGKMNNADRILVTEGAVPDFVLRAEFVGHTHYSIRAFRKKLESSSIDLS